MGFHTHLLTPWSRVLLEKLTVSATSQEIPRIFGTRRFITVHTSARHLSLSWTNSIQSSQPPPTYWKSILILSSHLRLGLPSGLFPSGFPTRTLCTPLHKTYKSFAIIQHFNSTHIFIWVRKLDFDSLAEAKNWSSWNEIIETFGRLHPLRPQNKQLHTQRITDYKHTGQDRRIQKEMVSTHTKNATKPNTSKILQLQTARKKINWTT